MVIKEPLPTIHIHGAHHLANALIEGESKNIKASKSMWHLLPRWNNIKNFANADNYENETESGACITDNVHWSFGFIRDSEFYLHTLENSS